MDNGTLIITVAASLLAFLLATLTLLRGWRDWLELKRAELDQTPDGSRASSPSPAARIELADLKERVRRLEAIANGVEG